MTTSDPAHPPRPGEGTGPLPSLTTAAQPAHTTGPLPPLPETLPESAFRRALRLQLAAIDSGRSSLREGLGQITYSVLSDIPLDGFMLTPDMGLKLLEEVPDTVIRFWLSKVAAEQVTLEAFLGALTAEGLVVTLKKSVDLIAGLVQKGYPGLEQVSAMKALNMVGEFDAVSNDFRQQVAELVAKRVADELKSGLDAQTANHLMNVLRNYKA